MYGEYKARNLLQALYAVSEDLKTVSCQDRWSSFELAGFVVT